MDQEGFRRSEKGDAIGGRGDLVGRIERVKNTMQTSARATR